MKPFSKISRLYLIAALTGLALLAAIRFSLSGSSEPPQRTPSPPPVAPLSQVLSSPAEHGPKPQAIPLGPMTTPVAISGSRELLTRYNSGTEARALLAYALQHPEKGGAFYASRLLTQCRGLAHGTEFLSNVQLPSAVGEPDYAQRADAAAHLNRRCAGLLADEMSIGRDREILSQGEKQGDPLVRAVNEYSAAVQGFHDDPSKSEPRRAAIAEVLDSQDPLLIEDLGMRLALYVDSKNGKKYFWFGGKTYPLDSDSEVGSALYLLPCGLGMLCDKTEYVTASRCASGAGCDAGRFEYLRRLYETRPQVYEKVTSLYSEMLQAVKEKKASAFSR